MDEMSVVMYASCAPLEKPTERRVGAGPDADGLVLRSRRDIRLGKNSGRPRDITDPVGVARQRAHASIRAGLSVPLPDLDGAIAPTGDKPPQRARRLLGAGDSAGSNAGGPADGIDAQAVRRKDLVAPGAVAELENRDVAVRGGARENAARVVRCPGNEVHGRRVQLRHVHPLPLAGLLAPDEDLAVVAGRREDVAVLGVRLVDGSSAGCLRVRFAWVFD